MQTSLPKRPSVGTGELPSLVDRMLDERRPPKLTDFDSPIPESDPIERLKALIRKPKGEDK
jgi:hypothetical protein